MARPLAGSQSPPMADAKGASLPMAAVPLAEAKNQLSALIARVELGEEIAITRRGVPVVRMVPALADAQASSARAERVDAALAQLRNLRGNLVLEGDLRTLAREGLA